MRFLVPAGAVAALFASSVWCHDGGTHESLSHCVTVDLSDGQVSVTNACDRSAYVAWCWEWKFKNLQALGCHDFDSSDRGSGTPIPPRETRRFTGLAYKAVAVDSPIWYEACHYDGDTAAELAKAKEFCELRWEGAHGEGVLLKGFGDHKAVIHRIGDYSPQPKRGFALTNASTETNRKECVTFPAWQEPAPPVGSGDGGDCSQILNPPNATVLVSASCPAPAGADAAVTAYCECVAEVRANAERDSRTHADWEHGRAAREREWRAALRAKREQVEARGGCVTVE